MQFPQIISSFTRFQLTEEQTLQGSILSANQAVVIQNQISEIAEEKLNLEFTPNDPLSFAQQEAYLKGKLDILMWVLAASDAAQAEVLSRNRNQQ